MLWKYESLATRICMSYFAEQVGNWQISFQKYFVTHNYPFSITAIKYARIAKILVIFYKISMENWQLWPCGRYKGNTLTLYHESYAKTQLLCLNSLTALVVLTHYMAYVGSNPGTWTNFETKISWNFSLLEAISGISSVFVSRNIGIHFQNALICEIYHFQKF